MEKKYFQISKINLSETIADKIEEMILDNTLKEGHKFPPETELAEYFGVSRNILREAMRGLKERGLIRVHSGKGVFVARPKGKVLGDTFTRFIKLTDISLKNVYEFRSALEVSACGLAAERASLEEIEELEAIAKSMKKTDNIEEWVNTELQFHIKLAKAAKNPLFYNFIKPLTGLLSELFSKGYPNLDAREEGVYGHMTIVELLKKRDKAAAEKAMLMHLSNSQKFVLS